LNIALIGAGFWGKNLARKFYQLKSLRFICDTSEEILRRKNDKYPDVITNISFPGILSNSDIDAVVIATPAEMHYSMVKSALLSKKHVFVEKPLALTEREGEELVEISKSVGKVLFVGHILQYHPAIIYIKDMIRNGELGKLQYIYSNRLNLGKIRKEENILWSFAPHDISVILSLVNEEPYEVKATGSAILNQNIFDTTLTHFRFSSGASAHIFVSWLHPFKEQKLVVIGEKKMIVFDDMAPVERKLIVYPHNIIWKGNIPVPEKKKGMPIDLSDNWQEPLEVECLSFIEAVKGGPNITDGAEGLKVLRVLQRAQNSLDEKDIAKNIREYFIHECSFVDEGCHIGRGTKIWHFSHILSGSKVGDNVNIGQNVVVGPNGIIGSNVKIQNNVSIYEGVILEDDVFCGPSCVFTNVINPRSAISRKHEFKRTLVKKGATIGANATILCGITIGKYAFIGAGAVVTKDVPDYGLIYGNPAALMGWMCECGNRLDEKFKCMLCGKMPIGRN
jgi:UDP-2-acetamido-3-amino-2,3-dideoxy-glucuronate N-acetyltransferase